MNTQIFTRDEKTVEAYVIEIPNVIPLVRLRSFDTNILDDVVDFDNYIMPNGSLAPDYYETFIVNIYEYLDLIDSGDGFFITERIAPVDQEIQVNISREFPNAWIGITLYDVNENIIPDGSATGDFSIYGKSIVHPDELPIQEGVINATNVNQVLLSNLPMRYIRVTPNSITGADTYRLTIYQNTRG